MNALSTTLTAQPLPLRVRALISVLNRIHAGTLSLTTPDGSQLRFGNSDSPKVSLIIKEWSALRKIFRHGDIGLAECYRDGLIECDDITALIRLGIKNQAVMEKAIHGNTLMQFGYRLRHLFRANTRNGSKRNIQAHYDLGNDFYQLWLDPSMTYSSAYFGKNSKGNLMLAQFNKYQRLLDQCDAKTGDRILEIGCGWGGFAEYAAYHGIEVHGVTLSKEQLTYSCARLKRAGLDHLTSFELCDYRDIQGQFDHIVSIEMLEAVGEPYWEGYFQQIQRLLKPGGKALIQTITIADRYFHTYRKGTDFIQQYIFPGGMLPCEQKLMQMVSRSNLSINRIDRFGQDYAETLRRWRNRFEAQARNIKSLRFDEAFIRLWRFYLCYCEAGFDESRIDVIHLQLSKEKDDVRAV